MRFIRHDFTGKSQVVLNGYLYEAEKSIPRWQKRPAVVVCPGGGYAFCSDREADPIAMQYLAAGFHTFVFTYSVGEAAVFPNPLCELSLALKYIRDHSEEWGIIPDKIAICGFSAGGHLAASLGTLWNHPFLTQRTGDLGEKNRPNALILGYPVISTSWIEQDGSLERIIGDNDRQTVIELLNCHKNVGPHTPETFLFHTFRDNIVPVEDSLKFADALAKADIPFELHIYPNGPHGLSLATPLTGDSDTDAAAWMGMSINWLWRLFEQESETINRAKP